MRTILAIFATVTLISIPVSATIWVVDNNAGHDKDFTTLAAAHTGASAGDTLHVIGSPTSYGAITLTKQLTIIGTGFFLTSNTNLQASAVGSYCGAVTFDSGSEGSIISGIYISNDVCVINTSDITVKRCRIEFALNGLGVCRVTGTGRSNISIIQNYIENTNGFGLGLSVSSSNSNILIANNYIGTANSIRDAIETSSVSVITHNVLFGNLDADNSTITNNILREGSFFGSNNTFTNNMGNSTQFGTDDGNLSSVDMSTVFQLTGSTDGQYQLIPGTSPALGAGVGGVDMGMFGGSTPYVLSGIPAVPTIYSLDARTAGSTNSGLPVTIKIRSND